MFGTEGSDLWWLIPLILIGLCMLGARGCCSGRRYRSDRPEKSNETDFDSALEILNRRYASGEIDDEEYTRKRNTLTQTKKERRDDDGKNKSEE